MTPQPRTRNKIIFTLSCLALVAGSLFLYYKLSLRNQNSDIQARKIPLPVHIERSFSSTVDPEPAYAVEIKPSYKLIDLSPTDTATDDIAKADPEVSPFEEEIDALAKMLGDKVTLDDSDQVAIEIFISRLPDNLSAEELRMLGKYINAYQAEHSLESNSLSDSQHIGNAAQNLGMIVTRLYTLKRQENQMLGNSSAPANSDQMQALDVQLDQLRSSVLGDELKNEIFPGKPNTDNKLTPDKPAYLINKLRQEGLSDEQIQEQVAETFGEQSATNLLRLQRIEDQWMTKYLAFLEDKQVIMNAGLSEEDKTVQIRELFSKHYSPPELDAAIAFDTMLSASDHAQKD